MKKEQISTNIFPRPLILPSKKNMTLQILYSVIGKIINTSIGCDVFVESHCGMLVPIRMAETTEWKKLRQLGFNVQFLVRS